MREFQIGDIIAEQQLVLEAASGEPRPLVVRVGRPVRDLGAKHETWVCPFQIDGIDSGRVRGIFSVDAMQALLLSLHTIPVELAVLLREHGGRFTAQDQDIDLLEACRIAVRYSGDVPPE
jgi:hypothetical protein